MNKLRKDLWLRKVLRNTNLEAYPGQAVLPEMEQELLELNRLRSLMGNHELRFREGFADRTAVRLAHIQAENPNKAYFASLSFYFPKLAYTCLSLLVLLALVLFMVHGELNGNALTGVEKIDDSNFISYLILAGK